MLGRFPMSYFQNRYLGEKRKKKRVRRLHERKFVFDWDVGEDTSHVSWLP